MTVSERIGRHLRGNLVGYVALFVALSGTAIALPGKGKVKADDLRRGAVKTKAIKRAAVTNPKLAGGAVSSAKIADGSIVGVDLADSAVTSTKLADDAVTRQKIGQGQVNGGKLANGSVNSAKVKDGTLLAEDFAPDQLSAGFERSGGGTFNLPRTGRVFVTATFLSSCPTACTDAYAVQIDGADVPGSTFTRSGDDDLHVTLVGLTPELAAGDHTIGLTETGTAVESQLNFAGILLQ